MVEAVSARTPVGKDAYFVLFDPNRSFVVRASKSPSGSSTAQPQLQTAVLESVLRSPLKNPVEAFRVLHLRPYRSLS